MRARSAASVASSNTMSTTLTLRETISGGVGIITGIAIGLFSHLLLRRRDRETYDDSDDDDEGDIGTSAAVSQEEYKLVFCVRTDLKMQKGKIAAQVGHATLGAYKKAVKRDPIGLRRWEKHAQPKIALQIAGQRQADQLQRAASRLGLVTYTVYDAGRTQIAAGSMTVLAVGPGPVSLINQVTGKLKLL